MRALVTGGSGFAGSYLVKELIAQNHQVTSVGNGTAPAEQADYYHQIDLMDEKAVAGLRFKDFDVVFHLAGLANPGESFVKAAQYFTVNSQLQINLFEACLAQQATPKFIVISSAHVYSLGPSRRLPKVRKPDQARHTQHPS